MPKYILTTLFLLGFLTSNLPAVTDSEELRMDPADVKRFAPEAANAIYSLRDLWARGRELAIQSSNGTLGTTDRAYLVAEWTRAKEVMNLIIARAYFVDSYGEGYAYLKDGFRFQTLVSSANSQLQYPKTFDFKALDTKTMGRLVVADLQITPQPKPASASWEYCHTDYSLKINGVSIAPPCAEDDGISSESNASSAIAIGKSINLKSTQTKVTADIQHAVLSFPPDALDQNAFPKVLSGDAFRLNGVQVTGAGIISLSALIEAINNVSASSGVKARMPAGIYDGLELYTLDGRNIAVELDGVPDSASRSMVDFFKGFFQAKTPYVFAAPIRLRSENTFVIEAENYPALGFQGSLNADKWFGSLDTVDLSTWRSASEALAHFDSAIVNLDAAFLQVDELLHYFP